MKWTLKIKRYNGQRILMQLQPSLSVSRFFFSKHSEKCTSHKSEHARSTYPQWHLTSRFMWLMTLTVLASHYCWHETNCYLTWHQLAWTAKQQQLSVHWGRLFFFRSNYPSHTFTHAVDGKIIGGHLTWRHLLFLFLSLLLFALATPFNYSWIKIRWTADCGDREKSKCQQFHQRLPRNVQIAPPDLAAPRPSSSLLFSLSFSSYSTRDRCSYEASASTDRKWLLKWLKACHPSRTVFTFVRNIRLDTWCNEGRERRKKRARRSQLLHEEFFKGITALTCLLGVTEWMAVWHESRH